MSTVKYKTKPYTLNILLITLNSNKMPQINSSDPKDEYLDFLSNLQAFLNKLHDLLKKSSEKDKEIETVRADLATLQKQIEEQLHQRKQQPVKQPNYERDKSIISKINEAFTRLKH